MFLVIGASGFLGRRMMHVLPDEPAVGICHKTPAPGCLVVDLRDREATQSLIYRLRPRLVIYAAGLTDVDQCEREPDLAQRLNTEAAAEISRVPGVRVVYISTDYVFDGRRGHYREDDRTAPVNVYGATKLAGERAVLEAYSGNLVVRVSGLYDSHGIRGERFSEASAKDGDFAADDTRLSSPVHVEDVIVATRLLLRRNAAGLYHVAGPDVLSRYEFRQLVALAYPGHPPVVPVGRDDRGSGAPRPADTSLCCERLRPVGWRPRRVSEALPLGAADRLGRGGDGGRHHHALLIDCIGGLLTPRTSLPRAPELDRIDAACAGVTDGSVFWRKRAEELGLAEAVIPDLIRQVANRYAPNPPVWRHLLRWRRQHRLVLVNNGAAETFHHWLDKYGLERVFDLVINSAEFGLRKPERSFFLEVTRLLDIPPEKCVLIDDQTENIASAKSCGIKGAQTIPLNLWPLCQHQLPDSADMVQSSARRGAEDLSIHDGADAFMFRQFSRHSTILRTQHRHRYFMLSGGANLFPVAPVWKELLSLEVQSDLAYGWYTSQQGFPTLQHAVALWENYTAAQGAFLASAPLGRCVAMTLGASQAVAAIFDFVATTRRSPTVVLVGYNYPLFERQARRHRFRIIELLGEQFDGPATLPPADAVAALLAELRPALLVLVLPNNPAGEQYTEPEIAEILRAATAADTLVLLDQVGQMPMVQESWRNVGKVAADTATQAHMVLVNSFSKTDSIPGFRVGYMLGPEPVIQHTARFQLQDTMNPPTVPILPVFFTLLARCITVGERLGWARANDRTRLLRFARHLFAVTTAIAPPTLLAAVRRRLSPEQFDRDYQCYVDHQTTVARAIEQNHAYVLDRLRPYIERVTFLQGGFNFLIELAPFAGKDEDDVCSRLMAATGVALLTESCFRVGHRRRNNFWVRISLAAPTELFASAVDRLQGYLARF